MRISGSWKKLYTTRSYDEPGTSWYFHLFLCVLSVNDTIEVSKNASHEYVLSHNIYIYVHCCWWWTLCFCCEPPAFKSNLEIFALHSLFLQKQKFYTCTAVSKYVIFFPNHVPDGQGRTQKISEGGQVSSQLCDVTNQLQGKCRRHDHSRGVGGHAQGKVCKITPKNTRFCAFWKQVLDNVVLIVYL